MYFISEGKSLLTFSQPLEIKNTKFTTEVRAGLTTFFTMAYIIAVNVRTPICQQCLRLISPRPRFSPTQAAPVFATIRQGLIPSAKPTQSMQSVFKVGRLLHQYASL
jgi:hypothetical protein